MEKFRKLRDGDFWVLDTNTDWGPLSEGLRIVKDEREKLDFISLYLWGADKYDNPYLTPKDFLLALVKSYYSAKNARKLVDDKFIDPPVHCMGIYTVGVNKGTAREQNVSGMTDGEAIINSLDFLSNSNLIEIINQTTTDRIVPVYCRNGNPDNLTINENYPDAQQIGYALVDVDKMEEDTFYQDPVDAVDEFIAGTSGQDRYGYEYYIWDEDEQEWCFEESGGEYLGDNPYTNGFFHDFEAQGIFWEDAKLDETFFDEDSEDDEDWPDNGDKADEDKEEWYEDYEDAAEISIEEVG